MAIDSVSSATTPVATPTAATENTKPTTPVAPNTPAEASVVDKFDPAPKPSPMVLNTPAAEEADPFADCEFDAKGSGGGTAKGIDPSGRIAG